MFKKIEIWVLYLFLVLVLISYSIFGALVLREEKGGYYRSIITPLQKISHFIARIPSVTKNLLQSGLIEGLPPIQKARFNGNSGFNGDFDDEEKYLLLARYDGDNKESIVELISLNTFQRVYKWNPDINQIIDNVPLKKKWENIKRDHNESRFLILHPLLTQDGGLIFTANNFPLVKIDKDSNLEWLKSDEAHHHSIERDIDGNIWACVNYFPFKIDNKYVGGDYESFFDNGIRKISPDGNILFDKSISEIFIENNMEYLLFSTTDDYKKDPIHLNDIEPIYFDSKHWKKGDLFLSLRNQSMILLYRPSNNKIIWKTAGNFFNQHDVDIISESEISIFDNNVKWTANGFNVDGNNRIVVYNFQTDSYSYYLENSIQQEDVRTISEGRSQILPNGDLFIEETNYGRLLYLNRDGSKRWSYINSSTDNLNYYLCWSRIIFKDEELSIINKFNN